MPTVTVTSTEFKNRVGEFQDKALAAPVHITKNGREHTILISAEEYHRLKLRDRQVFLVEELDDETLEAIANSKMPEGFEHLNEELD
jgi:prevent-host-death family protein